MKGCCRVFRVDVGCVRVGVCGYVGVRVCGCECACVSVRVCVCGCECVCV